MPRRSLTLLVVSHVVHYRHQNRLFAYGAYAREIDRWARLFRDVVIAAPCRDETPPSDALRFEAENLSISVQPETGGTTVRAKLQQLALLPWLAWKLARSMRRADAIHVRAPGNLGLVGMLLAPLFSRRLVAKYAGQWTAYPGEPWTERLQRAILRSRWWRGPVTVYGRWPDMPPHVVPFFTSVLTAEELLRAQGAAARARPPGPLRVLYVGRLDPAKNVDVLLAALAELSKEWPASLELVGDGSQRGALEARAHELGVDHLVHFRGAVPLDAVAESYERSEVLVLASEAEGWPKALAEGMTFGLVCIGSERGLVPWLLGEGRGILVPPRDVGALVNALRTVASDPGRLAPMRERAAKWGQLHSLDGLQTALDQLLDERWGGEQRRVAVLHLTDTLEAGGAERMAVNLVNALPRERFVPHLGTTRRDGPLESLVFDDVQRLRLGRSRRWDVGALIRLAAYNRRHAIRIIHAHETSMFAAVLASLLPPFPAVVWHDHYGRYAVQERPARLYRLAAWRIRRVIAVNTPLVEWSVRRLHVPRARVQHLPNFVSGPKSGRVVPPLPGCPGGRIVCVANLRPEKDHLTLLQAMEQVIAEAPTAHLLLIGSGHSSEYRAHVEEEIARRSLRAHVTILGERMDVLEILQAVTIGVLTSASEGFPLVLLEYGMARLPVVATRVGQCAEILDEGRAGILVPTHAPDAVAGALIELLHAPERRRRLGDALHSRVEREYSRDSVVAAVAAMYEEIDAQPVRSVRAFTRLGAGPRVDA